ncbi:hypothetical protein PAALTS15_17811 [Paenibacillus alvei TS-15]|uniref:DUF2334 domain-containing protein n=1 Tax=Paenibacillus alvei TS-15 TaxID=1117108 RepID=S9SJF4_PAEAL|nr:hypothetical protein [Paenibacillus alvei]EPY05937.1 hypothetical protein PAALTS15_17811 [Paenibacillus alvei TS-15]
MIQRKLIVCMLALLLLLGCGMPMTIHAAEQAASKVLLIYDSLDKGTTREGNVEAMQRLLASYGVQVTLVRSDLYQRGQMDAYAKVIGIHNLTDLKESNQDFLQDVEQYRGDYLHIGTRVPAVVTASLKLRVHSGVPGPIRIAIDRLVQDAIRTEQVTIIEHAAGTRYGSLSPAGAPSDFPYGVRNGRYGYAAYFERGNISELAMSHLLKDWLGNAGEARSYVIFKEVYPFSDLQLLERLADRMYEAGIPFIASVQPVFMNTDYPAMKRYMETLKYVQSRNGSIIANAPVVASTVNLSDTTLKGKMEGFIDVLADYGVAPLGLGADFYWTYDQRYAEEGMSFTDSVVLFPNKTLKYRIQTNESKAFPFSAFSMQPGFLEQFGHSGTFMPAMPMNTALTFDFPDTEEKLDDIVEQLQSSWITFSDYKHASHTVRTPNSIIMSRSGSVTINGQGVNLDVVIKKVSSDYVYKEKEVKSFETLFNVQNKIFIVIIVLTLIAFTGFLIVGKRLYKRKYYK